MDYYRYCNVKCLLNADDKILSLNAMNIVEYLFTLGWTEIKTKRDDIKILQLRKDDDLFQVNIPLDRELVDYKRTLYMVVETIASAYNLTFCESLNKVI